jgi:abortive infection bacteriophage resistance protein
VQHGQPLCARKGVRAGFRLCISMAVQPYQKPYLNVGDQLALLKARGMGVTDDAKASAYLERIGYYRLSGYWYPFRVSRLSNGVTQVGDNFRPGTTFAHVIDLYVFDKKLRLLFLDAIERIEVSLRVDIALHLGSSDPWAHRNPSLLHPRFQTINPRSGLSEHQAWLNRLDEQAVRSNEEFAHHFSRKYSDPLPLWMAIELWDFGMLSSFLKAMTHADQTALSAKYGIPRAELLTSWARSINHIRNICAHHSRLWNRSPADQPAMPRMNEIPMLEHVRTDSFGRTRLYAVAAIAQYFLRIINPTATWKGRLGQLLATFPQLPAGLSVSRTGFPADWQQLDLWR